MAALRNALINFAGKQRGLHAMHAQVFGLVNFGKATCALNVGKSEDGLQVRI
jgi:hypothetical protein